MFVNITTVLRQSLQLLAGLEPPAGIELLSYKRNRTVALILTGDQLVTVRERGFLVEETTVPLAELSSYLKAVIKREFPRSRKVRINKFAHPDELKRVRKII